MIGGHLLGLSLDVAASPAFRLNLPPSGTSPSSWGIASYPEDDAAASVKKEPREQRNQTVTLRPAYGSLNSTVFLMHSATVARRTTPQDAPPFARTFATRDIVFAHSGDLASQFRQRLSISDSAIYQPVGSTDSEHLFCWLLNEMHRSQVKQLADIEPQLALNWLHEINATGTLSCLITDGIDVIAYRDSDARGLLHHTAWAPPANEHNVRVGQVDIDLEDPRHTRRSVILFSSDPVVGLASQLLDPGQLLIARHGRLLAIDRGTGSTFSCHGDGPGSVSPPTGNQQDHSVFVPMITEFAQDGSVLQGRPALVDPIADTRVLRVNHETVYTYSSPVIGSAHMFRLQPVHDERQELLSFSLEISPSSHGHGFEDVFGNRALVTDLMEPYTEFRISMQALVRTVRQSDDMSIRGRTSLPMVWMPWQRQMMHAYLLPPELPESQLQELSAYAMSFVARQGDDVVLTLRDINTTIYREFEYLSGSTTLETTPFDVYINRRGVCQDFANLFICLARLLSVPARYRVGYIYTGGNYQNKIQSEASHAWAEVYLPSIGWRGFDPTNGTETGMDHIRVAVGRNYRDATPTSGTIFKGGGSETLAVTVQVTEEPGTGW